MHLPEHIGKVVLEHLEDFRLFFNLNKNPPRFSLTLLLLFENMAQADRAPLSVSASSFANLFARVNDPDSVVRGVLSFFEHRDLTRLLVAAPVTDTLPYRYGCPDIGVAPFGACFGHMAK